MESNAKVLGSCRLTNFWDVDLMQTITATVLFWSDGSVTWVKE